jgi:hypothetical protein
MIRLRLSAYEEMLYERAMAGRDQTRMRSIPAVQCLADAAEDVGGRHRQLGKTRDSHLLFRLCVAGTAMFTEYSLKTETTTYLHDNR